MSVVFDLSDSLCSQFKAAHGLGRTHLSVFLAAACLISSGETPTWKQIGESLDWGSKKKRKSLHYVMGNLWRMGLLYYTPERASIRVTDSGHALLAELGAAMRKAA